MQIENITFRTKRMIDDLKTICANNGLGGSPGEYKIITQVFLYKYLSDKFLYEAKKADPTLANVENIEEALSAIWCVGKVITVAMSMVASWMRNCARKA